MQDDVVGCIDLSRHIQNAYEAVREEIVEFLFFSNMGKAEDFQS